jgi:uncharacterized protein (TIGR03067 family)
MAAFGLLFCLTGFQAARGLRRMLKAPRRQELACPSCGAAPPRGKFWICQKCWTVLDPFATEGACPTCGQRQMVVLCPVCGRSLPPEQWWPEAPPVAVTPQPAPIPLPAEIASQPATKVRSSPTLTQRIVWGAVFAFFGLFLCGLPSVEQQPLGVIIWPAGGAAFGALSAGGLTRAWKNAQARKRLRGAWQLVEEDGQTILDDSPLRQRLVLKPPFYKASVADYAAMSGTCWLDSLAEPPAISFNPTGGARPRQGIYRLENKTLTICLAYPDQPRPMDFLVVLEVQQLRVYRKA